MSKTNETTRNIIAYLFEQGVFAFRTNSTGVFDGKLGYMRTAPKTGVADILACGNGRFIAIEVKTGADRPRPEQIGFQRSVEATGGTHFYVKDFEDFKHQWEELQF